MEHIISAVISGTAAVICFVLSYLQFHEKGFLLNNAYIFASKHERETMDKKPHYKQSGMVFLLIGVMFFITAAETILQTSWLFYCVIAVAIAAVLYAIISSITIEKRKK